METIQGKPVTQEQIQAWADEAEAEYDVSELKKRGRPSLGAGNATIVPVRMDDELLQALKLKAKEQNLNRSEAIRAAVQAWAAA